jgi:hypothetical protein
VQHPETVLHCRVAFLQCNCAKIRPLCACGLALSSSSPAGCFCASGRMREAARMKCLKASLTYAVSCALVHPAAMARRVARFFLLDPLPGTSWCSGQSPLTMLCDGRQGCAAFGSGMGASPCQDQAPGRRQRARQRSMRQMLSFTGGCRVRHRSCRRPASSTSTRTLGSYAGSPGAVDLKPQKSCPPVAIYRRLYLPCAQRDLGPP